MALPVRVPTARFTLRIGVANRYGVVRVAAHDRVVEERPVERAVETVVLLHALVALIGRDGDQEAPTGRGRCARRRVAVDRQPRRVADDLFERPRAQ